jgi:hypothetical protein
MWCSRLSGKSLGHAESTNKKRPRLRKSRGLVVPVPDRIVCHPATPPVIVARCELVTAGMCTGQYGVAWFVGISGEWGSTSRILVVEAWDHSSSTKNHTSVAIHLAQMMAPGSV